MSTDYIAIIISIFSLIVSSTSSLFVALNYRIQRRKEVRERPAIQLTYLGGYWKRRGSGREYKFNLRVDNTAQLPTSIPVAKFEIRRRDNENTISDIVIFSEDGDDLNKDDIRMPCNLGPGEAARGWIRFFVPDAAIHQRFIDGYNIVLEDVSGGRYSYEPVVLTMRFDDEEKY